MVKIACNGKDCACALGKGRAQTATSERGEGHGPATIIGGGRARGRREGERGSRREGREGRRGERESERANESMRETRGGPPAPSALASCRRAMTRTAAERLGKQQAARHSDRMARQLAARWTLGPPPAGLMVRLPDRTRGPSSLPLQHGGRGLRRAPALFAPRCMPSGAKVTVVVLRPKGIFLQFSSTNMRPFISQRQVRMEPMQF